MCLFLVKTAVFQLEILINHHGNHFHDFMALVEEKKSKSFYKATYFSKYYQVAKYHSKLKFWSFHLKLDGLWQALLNVYAIKK